MQLDKDSLDIVKNVQKPSLFRITSIKEDVLSIEPIDENTDIYGNILIYSDTKEYVFDFAFANKDRIDYLFFLNANDYAIETIAKPKRKNHTIESFFKEIHDRIDDFEYRQEQVELAKKIYHSFKQKRIGVFEAPTGTGKSFAYLVPSILYSLENSKRIAISTSTINLQKQLIEKDIPLLKTIVDFNVKLAVGRGNYLCKRRLDSILEKGDIFLFENDLHLKLKEFAKFSNTGLKSELFDKDSAIIDENIWENINSSSITCARSKCKYYKNKCFYYKAQKLLESANIIVANHHIVLSDALLSEASILPDYDIIVFDEAHNLEKNATNYFTQTVSTAELKHILDKLYSKKRKKQSGLLSLSKDMSKIGSALHSIESAKEILKKESEIFEKEKSEISIDSSNIEKYKIHIENIIKAVDNAAASIKNIKEYFEENDFVDISSYIQRLVENCDILIDFIENKNQESIRWLKPSNSYVHFNITPINVADYLQEKIYEKAESTIFTSATISVNNSFDFFKKNIGINESETFIAKNNFNYKKLSKLLILKDAPPPNAYNYTDYLRFSILNIKDIIYKENLGALILFTSYKMLNETYNKVYNTLEKVGLSVLKQGDFDNFKLLGEFKKNRGFLFATSSFWEGVDIKGDALSLVFITRLPFDVPSTPIEKSRYKIMESQGINSFFEYSLPKAVLKFRQGFGRLIRSSKDKGIIIVSDSRIASKSYGKIFTNSLPDITKEMVVKNEIKDSVCSFFGCC